MRMLLAVVMGTAVLGSVSIPAADTAEDPKPLDTRTRCIVLFRECLLDIVGKNAKGLFPKIADGGGKRSFRINKTTQSLSPDLKRELEDGSFFERNFPQSSAIEQSFDKILFAELETDQEEVTVRSPEDNSGQEGRLHTITIKIPGIEDPRFTTLRFVEVGGKLYWVPFGW